MNPPTSDPLPVAGGRARNNTGRRRRGWVWVAVALTVAKLWLTQGQPLFAIGTATHDDQLFVNLAAALLRGEWLGGYNNLTLAKGPFYSIWLAGIFLLGVPLTQAQQLMHIGACALTVMALASLLKNGWAKLGIYALLLSNPMSFDMAEMGRVLRQNIYPPLALTLFAALMAIYLRRAGSLRRLAPWAATFGVTWAAFWLTREESVWIAPSLMLLGAAVVVGAWRNSRAALITIGGAAAIAGLCALGPVLVVCSLNARHYGWFGTVEFRAHEFKEAYSALLRVRAEEVIPYVPVTRATRERIYTVSPAFAELQPYLEGEIGFSWATNSAFLTHLNPRQREIGGGWFMWAVRQAVEEAGHGSSAREALAFYEKMAREINQACDDGRLPAGRRRSGFLPPWREGQMAAVARSLLDFADYFVTFRHFSAYSQSSEGSPAELDLFRDITRNRLSPPPDHAEYDLAYQKWLDDWKTGILQVIGKFLRRVLFALVLVAHAVWLVRAAQLAWRRRLTYPFVLAVAAWGGCAACLLVCAVVHVTSFPAKATSYFAPAYPLLLLFAAAVALDAAGAWRSAPREAAPDAVV